ncbi:unnamed protein product [Sphagnum jensenii]|uniref:Uncharacterized protein n=1 Tax=Sphagnum jensenii TaxID=128206 RepID=A0ABP0WVN5_9BRYO
MIPIAVVAHFTQEYCMLVAQMLAQVVHHSPVPRRLQQIIVRRLVPSRVQMGN